jgi:hypothetical protein
MDMSAHQHWLRGVAIAGLSVLAAATATDALAFDWSDTSLSYRYGWQFKEPGVANGEDIVKNILNLSHADGYKYGSNFVSIDILKSGSNDPANNSTVGAVELYGVFRTVLSGSKVFDTTALTFGPIKDIGLELGSDLETKNTAFAPEKRAIVIGPQFAIAIPQGFWNISIHLYHEWNNNGIVGKPVDFNTTAEAETAWAYPFVVGPVPLVFTGFLNIIAPKGRDGFGDQTRTEILAHPKIMVDVGQMAMEVPNKVLVGVGYEYWLNKFGDPPDTTVGTQQNALFFEGQYHF